MRFSAVHFIVLSAVSVTLAQNLRGATDPAEEHFLTQTIGEEAKVTVNRTSVSGNTVEDDKVSHMDGANRTLDAIDYAALLLSFSSSAGCLCVFDIDCTLSTRPHGSIHLSSMGQSFRNSFCGGCHVAAITAGSWRRISGIGQEVAGCNGGCKAHKAQGMARYLGVPPNQVYFFDDRAGNVAAFRGTGMNARQVSCGRCGASSWEIRRAQGVVFCR